MATDEFYQRSPTSKRIFNYENSIFTEEKTAFSKGKY